MTDDADLFAGLDEIDWAHMRHAYGPAVEVPDLLRALINPDPAVRESALDSMYGGVHHQGDVYPCTIAAIPFLLRIVKRPDLLGRADVVRLLASIGSAEGATEPSGIYREANQAIEAAHPLWERLMNDRDPRVREAAIEVLPACKGRRQQSTTHLISRLPGEDDAGVRNAIVRTVGRLARAEKEVTARDWLARIATKDPDQRLRLVALAEATALPGMPVVEVDAALEMVSAIYRSGTPSTAPAGFETKTLIGALRRFREQENEGRRSPEAADLVRGLSDAFGDRVNDRLRLLIGMLRSPDWECQLDALYPARNLIDGWRGDYRELIGVVAERIRDGHPRTLPRAVRVVDNLGALGVPATDALATALEATTRRVVPHTEAEGAQLPWIVDWPQELNVSQALRTFSNMGDLRALPMLAWVLDHEPMPRDAPSCVLEFGPRAAPLIPHLLRRLRNLPADDRFDHRRGDIVYALSAIGPAAGETLPDLLTGPITQAVVQALAAIGPDSGECMPVLRHAALATDLGLAVEAARSLWRVTRNPGPVLMVADRCFDEDNEHTVRVAASLLADVGQATTTQITRLRGLIPSEDWTGRTPLSAAVALWRITGDPVPLLPVLERVWTVNAHTRIEVASLWAELGTVAAAASPLLTAELGRLRRHTAPTGNVIGDEDLLLQCRATLTAMELGD